MKNGGHMEKTKSVIRVGTTEGRFRMVMPRLMREFGDKYPDYDIRGVIGNAEELRIMLEKGELDLAFSGISPLTPECIEKELLIDEKLYLVVSDEMLREYFPERYPGCIADFSEGADLRDFTRLPFSLSLPGLHCMQILDDLLAREGITLNCIHRSPHFDLHQEMAERGIAACFSLTMYLPHLYSMNLDGYNNELFVFPIRNLTDTNPVFILTNRDKPYVEGTTEFRALLKNEVKELGGYPLLRS